MKWNWLEVRTYAPVNLCKNYTPLPTLLLWASLLSDIVIYIISLLWQELVFVLCL